MSNSLSDQVASKSESRNNDLGRLKEEAGEPSTQALNAEIPKPLHKRAKRYALENDLYLREVLITALEEFLPE